MNEDYRNSLLRDFPLYASTCLRIRTKEGSLEPFKLNKAQKYLHEKLEEQKKLTGRVRAIILKGRQQGCCYSPDMRVLTADYRWLKIKDIEVGGRIIAIDENTGALNKAGRRTERRIRTATIEAKAYLQKETYEVITNTGVRLVVTGEHRHLCKQRGGDEAQWREVNKTKVGDFIRVLAEKPEDREMTYEDGWFSGMLDGEGSFGASPQVRIALSQVAGAVLDRAKRYLESNNIHYYELIDKRTSGVKSKLGNKPVHCLRIDRMTDVLKLLTLTRPSRFITRELFENKKLPKTCEGFESWAKVISIKPLGKQEVIDLQTSEKTFICEGLVSHNSTYVAGRYYHQVTQRFGSKVFILTHRDDATSNLYKLVQRYNDNVPIHMKPETGVSNAKELYFKDLDSGYGVGTAGGGTVGRSDTIQLLHGSEVAFWQNTSEISTGIMQTVADVDNTEIILESTANGSGNMYHKMAMKALQNDNEYQLIFIPWYWQEEYAYKIPEDFKLTEEETIYKASYKLTDNQMAWRRNKINNFEGGEWQFKQEYPANVHEAFQTSGEDSIIPVKNLLAARTSQAVADHQQPLVIGVDPAGAGKDRTAIIWRRGRNQTKSEVHKKWDTNRIVGRIVQIINADHPEKVFIDLGYNPGIYDNLKALGYSNIVTGVNFGGSAEDPERYPNKRAEMWFRMADWVKETPCSIEDNEELYADMLCVKVKKLDGRGRVLLQSKDEIKKDTGLSPDLGDALALTFAFKLPNRQIREKYANSRPVQSTGSWSVYG